ncbi:beta-ketoacyl-[acyl-carrier-protein] synthase II [candidate division KSB1 bacterium]|nr:MAG: beta-ketoacyl-[acyl-carrier-protein] synthase II [candidate division KSB1 bacterium 4484_219]RKY83448.1 MAG: beta-ketoacyl-[acyl-carrier-protein] synthase II [candidate division KSB1 bacterium]
MKRRVVVTGMGVITPIGLTVEEFWQSLIQGTNGVAPITRFDTTNHITKFAAQVKNFDPLNYIDRKDSRRMCLFTHYAVAAAKLAIEDSGLDFSKEDTNRIGVIVGSGIGGMITFEREYGKLFKSGPSRVSPFFIPMMISDIAPGYISIIYGLKGPNYATTSACATSAHAIGNAFRSIQYGETDIMIAGGSEAPITPMGLAGFNNMKAISERNDAPEKASRPFDAQRDGFVLSEGGGIVVLEDLEHAKTRGAKIYCEIVGVGYTADAYHITAPDSNGDGAYRAMKLAIEDAGAKPEDVDYINAHGTSTPANDKTESLAIKRLFAEHASDVLVSSNKSMIGHMLGAAGAVELVATAMTVKHDIVTPTINYEYPDPDCDLNYVPNQAVKKTVNLAISNSFGFGGHNVCIAVRKYEEEN